MVPLFWWSLSFRAKDRINMFGEKWLSSIGLGIIVGLIYFVTLRKLNITNMYVTPNLIGVVMATAVTEELVFSGFVAGYLEKINKGKLANLVLVAIMAAVLRLPILLFVFRVDVTQIFGVLLFTLATAGINAWIRINTNNVLGSIIARMGVGLALLG